MFSSRRKARELALRALYEAEIGQVAYRHAFANCREHSDLSDELVDYAEAIVKGIGEYGFDIDDIIVANLTGYDLDRLAAVDRNLIRIATFELYHLEGVPPAVSLNEAVELAKKYSTVDSHRFVNGVLGRILAGSPKANWNPDQAETFEELEADEESSPEIEEISPEEVAALPKAGLWTLKAGDEA